MESIIAKLLQDFEQGKMTRRQLIQSLTVAAAAVSALDAGSAAASAPAEGYVAKADFINVVCYQIFGYKEVGDFYAGLFGLQFSRL